MIFVSDLNIFISFSILVSKFLRALTRDCAMITILALDVKIWKLRAPASIRHLTYFLGNGRLSWKVVGDFGGEVDQSMILCRRAF